MKNSLLILAICFLLTGCNNHKVINGVNYDVYGVMNQDDKKNPGIEYKISVGSCVAAVLLSETIVVPLYVVLVDLWEPVGPKPTIKGEVPTTP